MNNGIVESVRLSSRQYALLMRAGEEGGLSLETMLEISQTTAGSVMQRKWLAWSKTSARFQLTADGLERLDSWARADVSRKNHARPISRHAPEAVRQRAEQLAKRIGK